MIILINTSDSQTFLETKYKNISYIEQLDILKMIYFFNL